MTSEQRLRQASVKMRLIAARELRQFMAGELDFLPGDHNRRTALDAIAQAYAAGLRDGQRKGLA
jgi:hypothetical protein